MPKSSKGLSTENESQRQKEEGLRRARNWLLNLQSADLRDITCSWLLSLNFQLALQISLACTFAGLFTIVRYRQFSCPKSSFLSESLAAKILMCVMASIWNRTRRILLLQANHLPQRMHSHRVCADWFHSVEPNSSPWLPPESCCHNILCSSLHPCLCRPIGKNLLLPP